MSDIMLSLTVIVCTGVLIGFIFVAVGINKKKKEQILLSYCNSHGYTFTSKKEALEKEITIEGDTFVLTSRMTSVRQEENTGSSAWDKNTFWVSKGKQFDCSPFVIGTVATSLEWERMPEWMKNAATQKVILEFGVGNDAIPKAISINDKMSLMTFEKGDGFKKEILDKLITTLKGWPTFVSLIIRCSPSDLSIHLNGFYIRDVSEVDRVLKLGHSLIG